MIADEEAPAEPHQAADERVHGVVADGAAEDDRGAAGVAQRGDIEAARPCVEGDGGEGETAVRGRGGEAQTDAREGISGLQVQAAEEATGRGRRGAGSGVSGTTTLTVT